MLTDSLRSLITLKYLNDIKTHKIMHETNTMIVIRIQIKSHADKVSNKLVDITTK